MAMVPDVTSTPAVTYVEGDSNLTDAEMNVFTDGKWSFDWTPTYASSDTSSRLLVHFTDNSGAVNNGGIRYQTGTLYITDGNLATQATRALTFSASQTIHIVIDCAAGELTISGATTGDGTYSTTNTPFSFGDDTTEVTFGARYNGTNPAPGTYANINDESGIAGSLSVTLGAATSSAAGTVAVDGDASATLGSATSSAAGTVAVAGASAVELGAVTSSGAGAVAVAGEAAVTLGAATLSAAGGSESSQITGALSATLGSATASSAGAVAVAGAALCELGAASLSASGAVAVTGSASVTLGAATLSARDSVPETPSHRIYVVTRESRVFTVEASSRSMRVRRESRSMAA